MDPAGEDFRADDPPSMLVPGFEEEMDDDVFGLGFDFWNSDSPQAPKKRKLDFLEGGPNNDDIEVSDTERSDSPEPPTAPEPPPPKKARKHSTALANRPKGPKFAWDYETKYADDLVFTSRLKEQGRKEEMVLLFNALVARNLAERDITETFSYKKMESQFGMKNRVGRPGDATWTDKDWDKIKLTTTDPADMAFRAAYKTYFEETAEFLGISLT